MNQVLHRVYMLELNLLLSRERQLVDALPKMVALATAEDLKTALNEHLEETRQQEARLEDILQSHTADITTSETCGTMQALLAESEQLAQSVTKDAAVKDAVIIAGARKVEHFEQASYQTAIGWADALGLVSDKTILEETLAEEEAAADELASLAKGGLLAKGINESAAQ